MNVIILYVIQPRCYQCCNKAYLLITVTMRSAILCELARMYEYFGEKECAMDVYGTIPRLFDDHIKDHSEDGDCKVLIENQVLALKAHALSTGYVQFISSFNWELLHECTTRPYINTYVF